MMIGGGHLQVLRAFAESQAIPVTTQRAIGFLSSSPQGTFTPTPEVEEALSFLDWLSSNQEVALTIKEELWEKIRVQSETYRDVAWEFYSKRTGRKRKSVPRYYLTGFFLTASLSSDFLRRWANEHPKFDEYKRQVSKGSSRTVVL